MPAVGISLWRYVYFELTRGYWLERDKARFAERRKRVYTFMKIPRELEKVSIYCFVNVYVVYLFWFVYCIYFGIVFAIYKSVVTVYCSGLHIYLCVNFHD